MRTRPREFLGEMERVVLWSDLVGLITPYPPEGKRGRPPFPPEAMLRIYFMQQWFNLSDLAMEDALHDVPLFREFAGLSGWDDRLPDETTILRFRHVLEKHKLARQILQTINDLLQRKGLLLKAGTVADEAQIAVPSLTKNATGKRDRHMKQAKNGNQWYFGIKAHIGVDADTGQVQTVRGTASNVNDVVEANGLLHGQETDACGDAGYQRAHERQDAVRGVRWNVTMRPGKRKLLDPDCEVGASTGQLEQIKARIRPKVEQPFRVIKRQFGHVKVRYRGLTKNTAQLHTLSNVRKAPHRLMAVPG